MTQPTVFYKALKDYSWQVHQVKVFEPTTEQLIETHEMWLKYQRFLTGLSCLTHPAY